ncbi:MAG: hypothetical protein FWF84_00530 [Kiritimatiellaeota bacterium]|nr:hypothetical protein [Kiritimatiellota bacterium]
MKANAVYEYLTLFIMAIGAAIVQSGVDPVFFGQVKPPCLLAVAVYYAWLRPLGAALAAAVVCGLLQDGLGVLPPGTSVAWMAFLAVACHRVAARKVVPVNVATCVGLVVAAVAPTVAVEYVALRLFGGVGALRWYFLLSRVAGGVLLALPVAAVTVLAGMGLNKMALKTDKEAHGDAHDWTRHRT